MGRRNAETAARYALEHYRLSYLISIGFAGALSGDSVAGNVFLYTDVIKGDGSKSERSGNGESCSTDLEKVAAPLAEIKSNGIDYRFGKGVTVDRLVRSPEDKMRLQVEYQTDAVDMESYWIGNLSANNKIPFLSVRAITDTAVESLPPFESFAEPDGRGRFLKIVLFFFRHPFSIVKLWNFYKNLRCAQRGLKTFLTAFLEAM